MWLPLKLFSNEFLGCIFFSKLGGSPSSFDFYLEFFLIWNFISFILSYECRLLEFFVISTRVKKSSWSLSFIDFSLLIILFLFFSVFLNSSFFERICRFWIVYIFSVENLGFLDDVLKWKFLNYSLRHSVSLLLVISFGYWNYYRRCKFISFFFLSTLP